MNLKSALPNAVNLPQSYAIKVDNISAISVVGEEQDSYLQGQLTCDLEQLKVKPLLNGSHCDAKGKLFSSFRLIRHNNANLLISATDAMQASMKELQKFGVFAKVEITAAEVSFLALTGSESEDTLKQRYQALPDSFTPVVSQGGVSIAYISGVKDFYLVIASDEEIEELSSSLTLDIYTSEVWVLNEIQSGFPHLGENSIREYVPQMLNMQHLNGISFTKGCYLGQETVARMKYLGKNKKALFALKSNTNETPNSLSTLEKQVGENWRRGGEIICHYVSDDGEVYLQAVLANDTEEDAVLRLKDNPDIEFNLLSLPYSLEAE
ncbi:tRNA-modifying protein YgfZ [Thalassotalea crassostreae]|uniref:tRNA-modifying protein YgfZ n=1 Tax=Thalassotalea crassostreae TaxID=1763536 RepID=UPI000838880A|nr:tRNA-modifying protein YgfZ [Thalassotalea crassostreae]